MSQRAPLQRDPSVEPNRIAVVVPSDLLARSSQVGIVGLFLIATLWCAHVAQPVLVPVLLAWVIATIAGPPIDFLQDRGVPRVISAILVTCSLVVVMLILLLLLSAPLTYWIGRAAELGMLIKQKLQVMNEPLAFLDEIRKSLSALAGAEPGAIKVEQPTGNVFSTLLAILTPAVGQTILFVGALLFQLIYWDRIQKTAVLLLRDRKARLAALRTLREINGSMSTYFSTLTIVNVCLAAVTMLLTWLVGLPNPLLWGVFAGVMNYIPYLGPAIVVGTLSVVGLVAFPTLGEAAVAPLIYVAIATLEGYFITPAIMGRRLELNPFGVFLAIAFCAWLWGPIGAFLAVPLLIAVTVASDHVFLDDAPDLPE